MKTKALTLFISLLLIAGRSQAQIISSADRKKLQVKEDSLKAYAEHLVTDSLTEERMKADSMFTRILVRTLQIKNSFYYPFDSELHFDFLSFFYLFKWLINYDVLNCLFFFYHYLL